VKRAWFGAAGAGLAGLACGGAPGGEGSRAASLPPLHLAPATDLAQGAGLSWLLDLDPRDLSAHAELLPAIDVALPRAELADITARLGFDPLSATELVMASYASAEGEATLFLVRGALEPEKLEQSFGARAAVVEGRAVDRAGAPDGSGEGAIVRTWGTLRHERAQMATFGRQAAALEVGRFGPLRVAELFAQERLKRASPALHVGPLARAAELLGPGDAAPARAFALGPFEGETAKGLGGLLAASTSAAVAARPTMLADRAAFSVVLVLTGGWQEAGAKAADRLAAAFDALSASPLGRLSGLDRPLAPVRVEVLPDALRLTVGLDALALARGARAAMGAEVAEMMSY